MGAVSRHKKWQAMDFHPCPRSQRRRDEEHVDEFPFALIANGSLATNVGGHIDKPRRIIILPRTFSQPGVSERILSRLHTLREGDRQENARSGPDV